VTIEIALVLAILVIALVLLIGDWLRMDLVSLMVLSSLALLGLVTPAQAVSGFSNPAVITVWAMFIMSEGLTRAGIADRIGRGVLRVAGRSEARVITTFMLVAGVLSAFMNNIGVAALLLPVAVEVARQAGVAPSRLLMPLAYGTLLGGLMTMIGTPPNLLVSDALREAGPGPFRFFDFTYIGLPILLAGTALVAVFGRHLLPVTDTTRPLDQGSLYAQYGLGERILALRVPDDSILAGRRLADSALGSAAGMLIIALRRDGTTRALPAADTVLRPGDVLLAQGRTERFELLRRWSALTIEREAPLLHDRLWQRSRLVELVLADGSPLVGERLRHREFRERHDANVLAIRRAGTVRRTHLADQVLAAGDRLLVQCSEEALATLRGSDEFDGVSPVTEADLAEVYRLEERLFVLRVPKASGLAGSTLAETRLGDAFDFRLLALFREGELMETPPSDAVVEAGDLLLVQGREEDLDVLRGLQQLETLPGQPHLDVFERGQLDLVEAAIHPHATLADRTVADLALSDRYSVAVAAVWRNGRPHRSALSTMTVQPGDALLIVGPRRNLAALNADPDLIVLNPVQAPAIDSSKAPLAGGLMTLVVVSVVTGFQPIAVAAVAGATLMVLTRCLTMEQAYRAIDWRSIFLIAGMMPLGIAMYESGAAAYAAEGVVTLLGPYGPWPVIAGLYLLTALGTLIVPTAALVLLMAPIALSAAATLGVAPQPAMMAVAIAASASLASPVAHPANILVMGPGGYRFVDYLKLGVPLTLVVFVIAMLLLPLAWPL
jgi:di/tricarboxylate transporter